MARKRRTQKRYTPEFKAEAVRLVAESENTMKEVAQELGVSQSALTRWCQKAGVTEKPVAHDVAEARDKEIRLLKKELTRVRQERDFLKKAAAFFARENGDDTP